MKISSWMIFSGAIFFLGFYESTFIAAAPFPLNHLRPIIPAIVMLFLLNKKSAAYVAAGGGGILIDLYKAAGSNFTFARYLLISLVIDFISERVITNRSLYGSWALVIGARLMDFVLHHLTSFFGNYFLANKMQVESIESFIYIGLFDILIITFLFIMITFFTKRFFVEVPFSGNRYG